MKIKCICNTGKGLSQITIASGSNEETKYPIRIGDIFNVYGQCIVIRDEKYLVLKYLIKGTYENLPSWYPAELFEVVDNQIHFEWYYRYNANTPIIAIWGYEELVFSENHYDDLIERKTNAIEVFLQRKAEIDEFN